jgi:hypothetical protein
VLTSVSGIAFFFPLGLLSAGSRMNLYFKSQGLLMTKHITANGAPAFMVRLISRRARTVGTAGPIDERARKQLPLCKALVPDNSVN